MARRGRPRRRKITYESKETKTFLGLLFLIASIICILTYLVDNDSLVFGFFRRIFGQATFLAAILFFNLALNSFQAKYSFVSKKSLFGQLLFLLSVLIIFTITAEERDLFERAKEGDIGGLSGYYIGTFLRDYIFAQFTIMVAFLLMFVSIPLMFVMTISDFLNRISSFINSAVKKIVPENKEHKQEENNKKAETFGDFNKERTGFTNVSLNKDEEKIELHQKKSEIKTKVEEVESEGVTANEELQFPNWKLPPVDLLDAPPPSKKSTEDIRGKSEVIEQTLRSFGINAKVVDVSIGPTVTQYALDIPLGTKVSKISNLKNDLALALAVAANAVRIETPIPGTSYIGIEVPNAQREAVFVRELIEDPDFRNSKYQLPVTVGKNISGKNIIANIQKMPHLLVAGATGSGKSVLTNSFILSLLMARTPDEVRFIMVDPKQVELTDYNGIPHLLTPVITDMDHVKNSLTWAMAEMESRYTLFRENQVRNIEMFNEKKGFHALPYIIIVIDEMADMMMTGGAEIESAIVRLAQKARATGIHLVLATQRPSVDVITGLIKANIPGRIGMSVTTQIDSRVILDQIGAESLLGMGDMLFKEPDKNKPTRLQGVLVKQSEIQKVVDFIKEQSPEVEYKKEVVQKQADPNLSPGAAQSAKFSDDELFADAVRIVVASGKGSSSLIQRKLSIGYNRAARLLDELYKYGVVGPEKGSKPRDVLVHDAEGFLAQSKDE